MAQHDYNIANQTGANFRADLNNALNAIATNNSGDNEPSTTFAYEWWIDTTNDVLKLRNTSNNAWITMPFSITADNTVDINAGTVNGITSLSFSSGSTVTAILDEDNLSSNSATALATQQSIKAYVDSQVTAQDLDISDGSSTISIDLDSETLSLLGGTGVTSAASGNGVTFSIGQSVGTSDNVVFNQVTGALVGNASTATALATARNISGVSFDGTANITLDTDNIGEGSSNLYFTNARVDSRFDTRLATKTTDNLTEGSSNKYFTNERVDDQVNTLLTAGANISLTYDDAAGTLTIANTNSADITSVVAGDGLTGGGTSGDVTLAVGVDDSSIEINSDSLRVKASGITNAMLAGSIANAKLTNSSITVNSQAIALGGSHTFDTDDIGEGSSNLYYTDARANSAIDARVTNTFINNLSGVVADTSTALATARTIAVAGDVVGSASFDGTSDISISTTIQANSVALGTDTTGNYIQTITGTANKITVSGSGSESADVTLTLPADVQIANDLTVAGDLTVNGDLTYLDTTNLKIEDNLFELNANLTGSPVNDSGMLINRGNQNNAIFMWDESNDKFALGLTTADGTSTGNITLTSTGTLVSNLEGNVTGTLQTAAQPNITSLGTLTTLTVDDITINGSTISDGGIITVDAGDEIHLDTANGIIRFRDDGADIGMLRNESNNFTIRSMVSDEDIIFKGNDGGSQITALTLDMSDAGTAIFNHDIKFGDDGKALFGAGSDLQIYHDGNHSYISDSGTGNLFMLGSEVILGNGAKKGVRVIADGAVQIRHNDSTKLATTSTGIDVTGVITTDGLTTSADINFGDDDKALFGAGNDLKIYHSANNQSYIHEVNADGSLFILGTHIYLQNSAGQDALNLINGNAFIKSGGATKLQTTSTGIDVTGTVTSDGLTSSGDVGIGTASPASSLDVFSSDANIAKFTRDLTTDVSLNVSADNDGTILSTGGAHAFRVFTNSVERVRIDSLGNLLVSTTNIAVAQSTGTGVSIRDMGRVEASADGNTSAIFNRVTSDGGIVNFSKDGTTVGSIGTDATDIYIGTTDTGIRFNDAVNGVLPYNTSSGQTDGTIDLGFTSVRWRDLYLSGTANVGGISANSGTTNTVATFTSTDSGAGINLTDNGGTSTIQQTTDTLRIGVDEDGAVASSVIAFRVDGSEKARIDSSGNLLVGTTSTAPYASTSSTAQGIAIRGDFGLIGASRPNNYSLSLNRAGTDGDIVNFRKNGTTVGSIGTSSSDLVLTSSVADKDILFKGTDGSSAITALTLDMSDAGKALFNAGATFGGNCTINTDTNSSLSIKDGGADAIQILAASGDELYIGANDAYKLRFKTDGNIVMDNGGSFGIGTNNPDSPLEIDGGSSSNTVLHLTSTTANTFLKISDPNTNEGNFIGCTTDDLTFFTRNSERMRLDSSGNVGINTTNFATTGAKLQVKGTSASPAVSGSNFTGSIFSVEGTSTVNISMGTTGASAFDGWVQVHDAGNGTNYDLLLNPLGGNVGIGNASPTEKLSILGGHVSVGDSTGANGTEFLIEGYRELFGGSKFGNISIRSTYNTASNASDMLFYTASGGTNTAERMRIASNGFVQIGTTTAGGVFTVTNAMSTNDTLVQLNDAGGTGNHTQIEFRNTNGQVGTINTSGSATSYNTSSDARLKDVTGEAKGLEVINKLNPVAYNWKADGKADEGLIAQEVMEVVPNAVSGSEEEMYQMDYSKLVTPLIKAIQEQQEQIETLKSEIKTLKGE